MAINDDFRIYPYSRTIRHVSGTTVYTGVQFYSWLMDRFDEKALMSYPKPLRYNTPKSFTMLNLWFLDNGDGSELLKYLKECSIDTSGYGSWNIHVLQLDTVTADPVASDKDKIVQDDLTDVGPLLAYVIDPGGVSDAQTWWFRDDRGTPAQVADGSQMTISGGTGEADANGGSVSGDDIYCGVYTLASFPGTPDPYVYIFQDTWGNGPERFPLDVTLSNADRGSIDVLIKVKEAGVEIDGANIYLFARQSKDTYAYATADLTAGERTPIAMETAVDGYKTRPDHYLLIDGVSGGTPAAGDAIQHPATGDPEWYAEIHSATNITGSEWLLGLIGLHKISDILDNDALGNGTWTGNANGTEGDAYFDYTPGTDFTTNGQLLTQATTNAKALQRGYSTAGDTVVCETDISQIGSNRDDYVKDMNTTNLVTGATTGSAVPDNYARGVAGFVDVTVAHVNGTVTISGLSGTFEVGEVVNYTNPSSSCIVAKVTGTTEMTLANVDSSNEPTATSVFTGASSGATANCDSTMTDTNEELYNFQQQSEYNYNIVVEGGTVYSNARTLEDIYEYLQFVCRDGSTKTMYTSNGSSITEVEGQAYTIPVSGYAILKANPFGYMAGENFFGARGLWLQGMDGSDANSITFYDKDGTERKPYSSVLIELTNTVSGDHILIAERATATSIKKDQYTSHNTNNVLGDTTFERDSGNFPVDTPSEGYFYVVDNENNEEHRYRYDSWSGTTLTMPTAVDSTATAGSTGQTLKDTVVNFTTEDIEVGDLIYNETDDGWGYVLEITDADTLVTTHLTSSGEDWASGDDYTIHKLCETYNNSDKFYVPYMDRVATGATEQENLLYASDRNVIIRVRNVDAATPIQPYEGLATIGTAGFSVAVSRIEDTVYT